MKQLLTLVIVMLLYTGAFTQHRDTAAQSAGQLAQQYFQQNGVTPGGTGGGITPETMSSQAFIGHANGEQLGYNMAPLGDVNGDGYIDIALGAHCYNSNTGRVYIYFGGLQMNTVADLILSGGTTNSYFGWSIAGPGDINGDGYCDVVVGAYGENSNIGAAYIFYGGSMMDNQADVVLNGEGVNNYFGGSVIGGGDINGDGYPDIMIAANGYNASNGKVNIYFGSNNYFFDTTPDVVLTGSANSYFGSTVAAAGDVNGDGYADVLVGEWTWFSNYGRANLFYGGASMNDVVDLQMTGSGPNMRYSRAMAGGRDVNGDGYSDFVIAGYGHNTNQGRADVFFGGPLLDQNGDKLLYGDASESDFGFSVALGDVNSDGFADVIVGQSRNKGKAFVFFGKANMDDISDVRMTGESDNNYFGICVASAGDLNNDGYEEFLVSASGYSSLRGKVYLYKNTFTGSDMPDVILNATATGMFGSTVTDAGDFNGDGYGDILIGSCYYNSSRGAAFLYYGGPLMDTIPDLTFTLSYTSQLGYTAASAGDVNGDGYADIVIGAPAVNNGTGRAFIYFGGIMPDNIADVILAGEYETAVFGSAVTGAGDMNGDGYADVAVGSKGFNHDGSYPNAGKVYLFLGGSTMDSIPDFTAVQYDTNAYLGYSAAGGGDINGDGYTDLIVGVRGLETYTSSGWAETGGAYVYFGGPNLDLREDLKVLGLEGRFTVGTTVSFVGDVNGDGFSDYSVADISQGYLYYGSPYPDAKIKLVFSQNVNGVSNVYVGKASSAAGDVNGDGFGDILVGCPADNYYSGRAYILYGGVAMDSIPDIVFNPQKTYSYMGASIGSLSDINGDGLSDVIVCEPGRQSSAMGSAYIYLSSSGPVNPRIISIKDVAGDQGGKVNVSFFRSAYDLPGMNKINAYKIERSVAGGTQSWNTIGSISPSNNTNYTFEASTQSDSTAFFYRVIATTSNTAELWRSNVMSGISIDNLAPAAVKNFAGSPIGMTNRLAWKANTEPDMHSYVVYRSDQSSIDPNTVPPFATLTDTVLTDNTLPVGDSYYFIRAKDIHGNYGALSTLATPLGMREVAVTALVEGLYDENANSMVRDTVTVELRQGSAPYAAIEQSKTYLNASGAGAVRMRAAENTGNYYIVIKHRNAIETWSKVPQTMADSRIQYDFTTAATTAYNDNLRLKGSKWCIFSGDVNQDGIVDYTDLSAIDNDSYNYTGGYVATDLTGDEFVDYTDLTIADNNNFNYVSVQSPLALLKKGATAQADNTGVPVEYEVSRNYPNPFNPSSRINYALPQDSRVVLNLYNMLGEKIATLIDREEGAGYHTATIQMNGLPSGAYVLQFTAGDYRKVQKIMLMK